ncbi:DUF985 domain-containing protein [Pyrenophora tritici-repentis]|nr:DUF985 domain-containing protein [Pyrenophora tritici-repentis]
MSSIPGLSTRLSPVYPPSQTSETEPASTQALIEALGLERHVEGGYFAEIDRNPVLVDNPFLDDGEEEDGEKTASTPLSGDDTKRNASTSIYYMLSAANSQGCFHRNKARTIHTLISGKARYILIHANESNTPKRIESFVVGNDYAAGERSVWVVEGGKYKGSFLLDGGTEGRCLISETVIPGFEYSDHDFLTMEKLRGLVTEEQARELEWLVRKD